ncbi:tRNA preQ1(34) S-adenosylmethionine ribosyltransferase-isomerase QueA, partial [Thioclava sp. BHET1]
MKLSDFDFDLPEALIATRPAKPRPSARLLAVTPDQMRDLHVYDLPDLLGPGDLMVLNNTKVIPARLSGRRPRQSAQGLVEAKVEVTL